MLYAILCYDSEDVVHSWTREQNDAVMQRLGVITGRLAAEGRLGPTARLLPTTAATTVRKGATPLVLDGPFAETKEQLGGYYLLEAKDLDEALTWAAQIPEAKTGTVEVRPIMEFEG